MRTRNGFSAILRFACLLIIAAAVLALTGCEDLLGPDTATIIFKNRSQNSTYDCILDGARVGAISPEHELEREVAKGSHTVLFKFANSHVSACSQSTPNLAAGQVSVFSCGNDDKDGCGCGD